LTSEIQRLAEEWNTAWLKKDVPVVRSMMTKSYVYIPPNGRILDRAAILGIISSPTYKLRRGRITDARLIEISANIAALVHRWRGAGTFQGRSFTDDHRCVTIFVKQRRRWLMAFEQCSAIG
jgi:ketosteroid isomerase-like protein